MSVDANIQATQFSSFPHINEVEPLSASDTVILERIKDILLEHGAIDRFGVHLIHKHYDIDDDEIVVEYTDEEKRIQTTIVQHRDVLNSSLRPIETQWRFNRETASMACVGYCDYNNGHKYIHNRK